MDGDMRGQLAAMLQSPQMRQTLQSLSQNPEQMQGLMRMMAGSNPALQQQLQPLLDNPELLRNLYNPDTLDAVLQFQQAASRLQSTGLFGAPPGAAPGADAPPSLFGGANPAAFASLFGQPPAPADARPAAERYADQLGRLAEMGFTDTERNIQHLTLTGGNFEAALERLLNDNTFF